MVAVFVVLTMLFNLLHCLRYVSDCWSVSHRQYRQQVKLCNHMRVIDPSVWEASLSLHKPTQTRHRIYLLFLSTGFPRLSVLISGADLCRNKNIWPNVIAKRPLRLPVWYTVRIEQYYCYLKSRYSGTPRRRNEVIAFGMDCYSQTHTRFTSNLIKRYSLLPKIC